MHRARVAWILALAASTIPPAAPASAEPPPPDRPSWFALYPPPPPGTFTPRRPPESTATRRPDLFRPVPVYPRSRTVLAEAVLDVRSRPIGESPRALLVPAGRLTLDGIVANPRDGDERGGFRIQWVGDPSSPRADRPDHVRLSEAYAFYKLLFLGASATIRAGQFVLPFGLAAVYDTTLQPFETLAGKSVGLRVDSGAMVEGDYGPFHYAGALTSGRGPNHVDDDGRPVLSARLERHFLTQSGRIQIGGSMLSGRLPETTPVTFLPVSGIAPGTPRIDKTRFSADVQYAVGQLVARGEIVFGADVDRPVFGYFGEARWNVAPRVQGVAGVKRWDYRVRPESSHVAAVGVDFVASPGLIVRALFERERSDGPVAGDPVFDHRLTVQTRIRL